VKNLVASLCFPSGSTCTRYAVAHPRRNRLLLFEGDRYHAVMHPSPPPTNVLGQRITLLVNWWRERPGGAADLPERFIFDLGTGGGHRGVACGSGAEEGTEGKEGKERRTCRGAVDVEQLQEDTETTAAAAEEGSRGGGRSVADDDDTSPSSSSSLATTTTRGLGLETLQPGFGFLRHLEEWRSQRLPAALAELGPGRALLVKYECADGGERGENAAAGGRAAAAANSNTDHGRDDELEWPFDDALLG
jgi:hypothetical protein